MVFHQNPYIHGNLLQLVPSYLQRSHNIRNTYYVQLFEDVFRMQHVRTFLQLARTT